MFGIDGSFGCNMNKLFSAVETTIEIQCFSKCKINKCQNFAVADKKFRAVQNVSEPL